MNKLDVNLWVLPGIMGRRVMLCDVGLKIKISEPQPVVAYPFHFSLGLPLTTEESVVDLVPKFYEGQALANLVFGNTASAPTIINERYRYNDGESEFMLAPVKEQDCKLQTADNSGQFSLWDISVRHPVTVGETLYVRVRFRVRNAGRVWFWKRLGVRRSFVISDLRVNELRDRPHLNSSPDFVNDTKQIDRTHIFLIASSRLRVDRVSPEPRYVRLLEDRIWENYLDRRLGRRNDIFTITYWRKQNVGPVTPFRAFIEHERRRQPAGRVGSIMLIFGTLTYLFLTPAKTLHSSVLWNLHLPSGAFYGAFSLGGAFVITRALLPYIPKLGRWVSKLIRSLENWRYRPR